MSPWSTKAPLSNLIDDIRVFQKLLEQPCRPRQFFISPHLYEETTWDHLKPLSRAEKDFWHFYDHCKWTLRYAWFKDSKPRRLRRLLRRNAKRIAAMEVRVREYQANAGPERAARLEAICRGEMLPNCNDATAPLFDQPD